MFFAKIAAASTVLVGLAAASPVEKRDFDAQVTFTRVDGSSFTVSVPADAARAAPEIISMPPSHILVPHSPGQLLANLTT